VLREANDDDATFIAELVNDPGSLTMIGNSGVRNAADARQHLRTAHIYVYGLRA
jgi:hypothetical protein